MTSGDPVTISGVENHVQLTLLDTVVMAALLGPWSYAIGRLIRATWAAMRAWRRTRSLVIAILRGADEVGVRGVVAAVIDEAQRYPWRSFVYRRLRRWRPQRPRSFDGRCRKCDLPSGLSLCPRCAARYRTLTSSEVRALTRPRRSVLMLPRTRRRRRQRQPKPTYSKRRTS